MSRSIVCVCVGGGGGDLHVCSIYTYTQADTTNGCQVVCSSKTLATTITEMVASVHVYRQIAVMALGLGRS